MRNALLGNLLGRALSNNLPAARATFRSKINEPVGGFDHIQVVLNHDNRIAVIAQSVEYGQQLANIFKM